MKQVLSKSDATGRLPVLLLCSLAAVLPLQFSRADDFEDARSRMVEQHIKGRGIKNERVLKAMRKVPRHLFIDGKMSADAYADSALPIGYGQTISQPYIVAFMTELLELEKGDRVLEVGTGSGYQAAVLAEMGAEVYTIEIVPQLAKSGEQHLRRAGYRDVNAKQGDGYYGWPAKEPFDAVIVTAAASHIPPPLVEQLKPGGRMVIPVGPVMRVQQLMLVVKKDNGEVVKYRKLAVRFVPLTGEH